MAGFFRLLLQDLLRAIIPPAAVFALYLVEMLWLWPEWMGADVHLHFLGGASIAWSTIIVWRQWTIHGWIPTIPTWLGAWTTWGTVALIGIFWEWVEWGNDQLFGTRLQPSLTDTLGDFVMDLVGGLIFITIALVWMKPFKKPTVKPFLL